MHYKKGFSIVEIIVAVSIFSLIIVALGTFQKDVFFLNNVLRNSISASQDAQVIMRTIAKELRTASRGADGSFAIVAAGTSSLTFYSDIDADGIAERVRYFIQDTQLRKGIIKASNPPYTYTGSESFSTLIYNVVATTTSLFSYYDGTYAGTTTPLSNPVTFANVRLIKVQVTIDADPQRSPVQRTYTTQISLRNLKDNL